MMSAPVPDRRVSLPRRVSSALSRVRTTRYAVGIDIGGTNTKLSIVNADGQIVAREKIKTAQLEDPHTACRYFREFADDQRVALDTMTGEPLSIGVAVPGVFDAKRGVLEYVANLPAWCDFPLKKTLEKLFGGSVAIANDANAAAYAEYTRLNKRHEAVALLTLGTGLGCGVVHNGQPYAGDHGCGYESGHVPVDLSPSARQCGCGKPGHLEAYVGVAGVVRTAAELAARQELAAPTSPRAIAAAAEQGDAICLETIDVTAHYIGVGAALLGQTLDPGTILIGGAMTFGGPASPIGRRFLDGVIASMTKYSLDQVSQRVVIDFAHAGGDAGMIGIAQLSRA